MANLRLSLGELSGLSGFPARTVRHYIQQSLLPPAHARGRGAFYGTTHLDRLRAIRRLRSRYGLKILVIRQLFNNLSKGEISRLAAGAELELDQVLLAGIGPQKTPDVRSPDRVLPSEGPVGIETVEMWATIKVTADIELRARGLGSDALGRLQALGVQLRGVILNDIALQPAAGQGLTDEGTRPSFLAPLDETLL